MNNLLFIIIVCAYFNDNYLKFAEYNTYIIFSKHIFANLYMM